MVSPRHATADDAAEVVRLRGVMLRAMGTDIDADGGAWRARCEESLREQLGSASFATFVVDAGDGSIGACCTAWIDRRLPGPSGDGRVGHLANVVTDPVHRRQGYARCVLNAAMQWFRQAGVRRVELHATAEGRRLYESAGFRPPQWPALQWVDQRAD